MHQNDSAESEVAVGADVGSMEDVPITGSRAGGGGGIGSGGLIPGVIS